MTPLFLRAAAVAALLSLAGAAQAQKTSASGDYIVAIVNGAQGQGNSDAITRSELDNAIARAKASRGAAGLDDAALQKQVLQALIDERILLTRAGDYSITVSDAELERAIASIATNNNLSLDQLKERVTKEGTDWARFRQGIRDQIIVERLREGVMEERTKPSEVEIDQFLASQQVKPATGEELNIAQILVTIPEGATEAAVAERQAKAMEALDRVKGGEAFADVAKQVSEDGNKDKGGEIGPKAASRLPDLFVAAVKGLQPGGVTPQPIRSGAGFHILKLISRKAQAQAVNTQSQVRHILIRTSDELTPQTAARKLTEMRTQIASGKAKFEDLARQHSADEGSAKAGGDLGWSSPGTFVPEFDEAIAKLQTGEMSGPVQTRFGLHLIQVTDRRDVAVDQRQLRDQARNQLRERKYEKAYADWLAELRSQAYIEMREPPLR